MHKLDSEVWPEEPYKGLNYYQKGDRALFAGRDDDVCFCAQLLAKPATNALVLHGITSCGKSSFLRAGLIPELESMKYEILRKDDEDFIRSTGTPIVELTAALYDFASRSKQVRTLEGPVALNLSDALPRHNDRDSFIRKAGCKPQRLLTVLRRLGEILPAPMVIVVDQAEEVFTLKRRVDDQAVFFYFLAAFIDAEINMKLLISMRTEFYGQFLMETRLAGNTLHVFRDYFLRDLDAGKLKESIERPTFKQNINGYGVPYEYYGFSYEEGLVDRIVGDLKRKFPEGGASAGMQIICSRLYEETKRNAGRSGAWTIQNADYQPLSRIEKPVDKYIDDTLSRMLPEDFGVPERRVEGIKWKRLLGTLVKTRVGGLDSTEIRSAEDLGREAAELKCGIDFTEMAESLSKAQILRKVHVLEYGADEIEAISCYCLGHDVIASALKVWTADYERRLRDRQHHGTVRATEASRYTAQDLYGESTLGTSTYYAADDGIWDHQLLLLATKLGFFERLGFELQFSTFPEVPKASRIITTVSRGQEGTVVFAYPRRLVDRRTRKATIDFAITNMFTGYALIGARHHLPRPFDRSKPYESFLRVIDYLSGNKWGIRVQDEGAYEFLRLVIDIGKECKSDSVTRLDGEIAGTDILDYLIEEPDGFIIGTGPTRAIAEYLGFMSYLDYNHVLDVVECAALDQTWRHRVNARLVLHNCWNVNVPPRKYEEQKLTILKMASVALCTLDFLQAHPDEATSIIYTLWTEEGLNKRFRIDQNAMYSAFRKCYEFESGTTYFDQYIDSSSRYNYQRCIVASICDDENESGCRSQFWSDVVYRDLMALIREYYDLVLKYTDLTRYTCRDALTLLTLQRAASLKERARKHHHIYNYVDAVAMLKQAIAMLERSSG